VSVEETTSAVETVLAEETTSAVEMVLAEETTLAGEMVLAGETMSVAETGSAEGARHRRSSENRTDTKT